MAKFHAGKISHSANSVWIACGKKGLKAGISNNVEIQSVEDFKNLPAEQQCAHCAAKIKLLKL